MDLRAGLCRSATGGVVVLVVTVGLVAAVAPGIGFGAAVAHDGDDHTAEAAAAHARADLVGTSMSDVVAATRRNARDRNTVEVQRRAARAARQQAPVGGDPHRVGSWSEVVDTEVVPVFQAVLPNGKVLMWDSIGDGDEDADTPHTFTRAMVWDPTDDTSTRVDVPGYNIFCAGYTQLPDGDVLVVGGNKNAAQDGIRQTHVFHWRTERWSRGPDMDAERWYPSVAALADGTAVIVAGGTDRAEVYDPEASASGAALRTLTGFSSFGARVYPFLVPRTDGRVTMVGPGPMQTFSTEGEGSAVDRPNDDYFREYASFATFLPDQTLVTGGGTDDGEEHREPPLRTAKVVDTSGSDPEGDGISVTPTAPMAFARRLHGLTLLPDGSALATGGLSTNPEATGGYVDLAHPVLAAERWDPATGTWSTMASAARSRQYHSSASLLPDGRVLTGGGGVCGACVDVGYLEKNIEYYSPAYLFHEDGSRVTPAERPAISAPTTVATDSTFSVTSSDAASIERMALVKLGAPTHSIDQGQRYVPLSFTRSGTTLRTTAPATTGVAPPGYYMLFAIDEDGVPSMAETVQVTPPGSAPVPVPGPEGPTGDLARDRPATASASRTGSRPASATDGRGPTRWVSPARRGPVWWRVDLGPSWSVDRVEISWAGRRTAPVRVQTSVDGRRFTTVRVVPRGSQATTTSRFGLRQARFVRVLGTRPMALRDVSVFGRY